MPSSARANQKNCINQRLGQGLACRLGRCFYILPYAEVSIGDPHPALPNVQFTLCDVRFFASLRMTRLYRSRRGGCPHPPEQIRKIVQTNGGGKVSPADSVGASTYFRMQRSPSETRTPPYQMYNLLCAM